MAQSAASTVLDHKGENVSILHVGEHSSIADYFVIVTAQSDRQVRALAHYVEDELKERGVRPIGVEGKDLCQWVLVDYGDVIVHVFREDARMYYDLDGLWHNAKRISCEAQSNAAAN